MEDAEIRNDSHASILRVSTSPRSRVYKIGLDFENQALSEGFLFIAGVDEVGRGCLAGPVVAAACVLNPTKPLPKGLNDSKKLTAKRREELTEELKEVVLGYSIAQVEADIIDEINILEATKMAMSLAITNLRPQADFLLIDALQLKQVSLPQKAIIKGDAISASIAAASILAKTYRDDLMRHYDSIYPQFGFASNSGYGTKFHFDALRRHGHCLLHRKSFRGVL